MMTRWIMLAGLLAGIVTPAWAGNGIKDVCGGIVEIEAPLGMPANAAIYSGPVLFHGQIRPPRGRPDLFDACMPERVDVRVDGVPQPVQIIDGRQTGQWAWRSVRWTVKGCHDFTIAVSVGVECDPVTPVHSAATRFCVR